MASQTRIYYDLLRRQWFLHGRVERKSCTPFATLQKVGKLWSVRVGPHHRALAVEDEADFIWVWIGLHDEYEDSLSNRADLALQRVACSDR